MGVGWCFLVSMRSLNFLEESMSLMLEMICCSVLREGYGLKVTSWRGLLEVC